MTLKIGVALLGVLGVTGGVLYMMSSSDTPTDTQAQQTIVASEEVEESFKARGSFSELMLGKGNIVCGFSSDEGGSPSEGMFYFDYQNNRFRVDVDSVVDGELFTTHVVNDSQNIYTWGTALAQGMVVDVSIEDSVTRSTSDIDFPATSPDDIIGDDEDMTYDCRSWKVDESVFVPDTAVEFMDMQEVVDQMLGTVPDGFDPSAFADLKVN